MQLSRSNGENGLAFWSKLGGLVLVIAAIFYGAFRLSAKDMGLMVKQDHRDDVTTLRTRIDNLEGVLSCMYWEIPPEECPYGPTKPPSISDG